MPLILSIHVLIVPFFFRSPRSLCPFSSVHRTNCAILTVRSPHFLSIYCDFIEFNVANNETESKRNFTFSKQKIAFFETENHWPYIPTCRTRSRVKVATLPKLALFCSFHSFLVQVISATFIPISPTLLAYFVNT